MRLPKTRATPAHNAVLADVLELSDGPLWLLASASIHSPTRQMARVSPTIIPRPEMQAVR